MPIDTPDNAMHQILVVDDEEVVLVSLRDLLRREGYQVVTAPNAVEALALLKEQAFSVVITDHQMPMLTGLEFLSQVKQMQPDASRILITAVLNLATVIDAINKGEIYRFIVKPWLREELIVTVKNAVQRYELISRNQMLQVTTLAMNEKLVKLNRQLEEQVACAEDQNAELERLNQALDANLEHSIELCLRTMQTFYPTLGCQARRVYELCRAMADGLQLARADARTLEISAWLHDIGLVGVPRQLIKRWVQDPASLTDEEQALIRQHPSVGQELTDFVDPLKGVGPVIRAHHERYDGEGYPDRLRGDGIPWLGRLLAVAVAYAGSPLDGPATVEQLKQERGKAFDPEAVRSFLRCLPQATLPRRQR
ncbi:MAG TPA: HD domain-containing phosphohydrolase, partial [Candidatus Saccharimonadales bacterium]|nr:HD domain-containing phosphohydrolase [Candidatus Saccharimonadales bacterium]